jgi:hypothetical protein
VLSQATFASFLGFGCAYLVVRTRSVYPAMFLHALVNGVVVVLCVSSATEHRGNQARWPAASGRSAVVSVVTPPDDVDTRSSGEDAAENEVDA